MIVKSKNTGFAINFPNIFKLIFFLYLEKSFISSSFRYDFYIGMQIMEHNMHWKVFK